MNSATSPRLISPSCLLGLSLLLLVAKAADSPEAETQHDEEHGPIGHISFYDMYNTLVFVCVVWVVGKLCATIGVPSVSVAIEIAAAN
jgi:hypothetical protein